MTTMPCISIRQPWPLALFVLGKAGRNHLVGLPDGQRVAVPAGNLEKV